MIRSGAPYSVDPMDPEEDAPTLAGFEKYLIVWIPLCMVAGGLLSRFTSLGSAIDGMSVGGISIPIGLCLFLMMYPAVLNLRASELRKLRSSPKPIVITLFANWLVAPLVGFGLGKIFLAEHDELFVAVILLSASPCTAMVLVWGAMAHGNQEQNVVNTSLNTVLIMVFYAPLVALLTGIQQIEIDRWALGMSVVIFIGLPMVMGLLSRRVLIPWKGAAWFDDVYRPACSKLSTLALLITLVVLFALNGDTILSNPEFLLLISIPLLLGFVIVVGLNIFLTRLFRLSYPEAAITVLIGSSSHFEIAIATAVAVYGVGTIAALGTTMGLFWEIPIMVGLVALLRYLGRRGFWKPRGDP